MFDYKYIEEEVDESVSEAIYIIDSEITINPQHGIAIEIAGA